MAAQFGPETKGVLMLSCWAIIPARGGSKGIPHKNLQHVGGVSLIGRAVRASIGASRVKRVFVSTEDGEIAREARRFGAEIIDRPQELAGDDASSESALLHALDVLQSRGDTLPEILAFVQCTSPFVQACDVDGTLAALENATAAACAVSARPFHGFLWRSNADGLLSGVNHDGRLRRRRQDLPPEYLENGAVYALRTQAFRETRQRFCGPTTFYLMPPERSLEIDDIADLRAARMLASELDRYEEEDLGRVSGVVFDFDGVMTDNTVIVFDDGKEAVVCSRGDGLGIELLRNSGIPMLILSKEANPVVSARARKLQIECVQGADDKLSVLKIWAKRNGLGLDRIAYLGNDANDIPCLSNVGFPAVVADAHADVLTHARIVLKERGGNGAVRELCDLIRRNAIKPSGE